MIRVLNEVIKNCDNNLAKAEVINKRKEQLYNELITLQEDYDIVKENLDNVKRLSDICQVHAVKYRDTRIAELEKRCEAILDLAFPDEKFGVCIETNVVRKKEIAYLLVGPKSMPRKLWFKPISENGGLVKQLIGASIIASICEMVGAQYLMLDEMFCSGDPVAVADINPFFESLIKQGIQLTIIEHKPTLYEGLPRREIRLGKDRIKSNAVRLLSNKIVLPEP